MFTIAEIKAADSKMKTGSDFPQFVKELKKLGIVRNDVYVSNGLSVYFDSEDHVEQFSSVGYPELVVNNESSKDKLKHAIQVHQQGKTDYNTFCKQVADSGVEKWVVDLVEMTCTYLDSEQKELVKETIAAV